MPNNIEVQLDHINKTFGSFQASSDVSFAIEKGRLIGLLGPSGSGKTTILRMIAGLEAPDSGDIFIGGRRVNDVPAGKRGIGFVFQNYALFRHMTVRENVAFGLKIQKAPSAKIKERVDELTELVGLKDFGHRYPMQLSGGQRQRVAFARALAPEPELLLLDEPFAAIDAKVRKELRQWLRQTIHKLGVTSIFVTHDQDEAVEVADDIIITHRGHVEQTGTPIDIYQRPRTPFVADFIGEAVHVPDYTIFKGFENGTTSGAHEGIIRPEFLEIGASEREMVMPLAAEEGMVRGVYFRGNNAEIDVDVKGQLLKGTRSLEKPPLHEGDTARVFIHRIYSFAGGRTEILENRAKQTNSVVI
ncbi:ABC transporter ATP-binding protein [Selenomonas sp.]|uniref:ABC transporter ATP-binding protein n=2 Tax=Selenomonas sp. TaxID=2053611 RepID=UPI0025F65045|nr:sulfate ABC transporter ATP-binding protein [Selenomonas sp.]MCI6085630.1 sulfate ABC transporter ATP-binding protein [Selenomonas sp.]MDY3297836.1 sulfate ABC transporter ATP-binding protein [Selenomonas sp.]